MVREQDDVPVRLDCDLRACAHSLPILTQCSEMHGSGSLFHCDSRNHIKITENLTCRVLRALERVHVLMLTTKIDMGRLKRRLERLERISPSSDASPTRFTAYRRIGGGDIEIGGANRRGMANRIELLIY